MTAKTTHPEILEPIRPGVTNKKEWDAFSRAIQSKKFPVKLAGHVQKDKVGLFNEWLAAGHNFDTFLGF